MNFTTENFSKKNKSTQVSKIQQAKGTLDIFGRLLFLSITKKVDVKRIFAYPLVPKPTCFYHPDGRLRDSPKSKMFQYLKDLLQSDSPPNVEIVIPDGMFLIRLIHCCRTYRLFVLVVLKVVLKQTLHRANICFDVKKSPSLKDIKYKKGVMTNPNVSFPLHHNKRCQVVSANY